ncbi:MAG TPA: MotA/TolQ/ExbB proton channel family protein [Candidatus Limnocylindria bacterium]|jgi:biopolymer transport protein ExbB|nr:MotA/TolQ/ExbB proton channel family protein [Candidatus Limnocylindria bacterium]
MFESIRDAGPFMWLLVVLSIISLTFILERAWALRRSRVIPPVLADALQHRGPEELRMVCHASPSPLARLSLAVIDNLGWPKAENSGAVEVKARREVTVLERGLVIIEIIVGIAPLLGLVGTIWAIIPLFGDFGKAVSGDNTLLAKGIAAALNKTLAGLLVAIPSLVAWSYFNKKVEVLAVELEGQCDGLIRRYYLGDGRGQPVESEPPHRP